MALADLHIHSCFSDGTYSPEEIVARARGCGAGLISVTDHNEIAGTIAAEAAARAAGLHYLRGCELDALFEGRDIHILCYGADFSNEALLERIRHARRALDGMSETLLRRMRPDFPSLDAQEFADFAHDPRLGGWKMLEYLMYKGVTARPRDGFPLYDRYGVTYADAGFDDAAAMLDAIHAAGGRAVLAHPGVVFPTEPLHEFLRWVERVLDLGLDGVECHYPKHTSPLCARLREICLRRGAMITAGSDCHGAFNHNEIAQTHTPIERLCLNGLALSA